MSFRYIEPDALEETLEQHKDEVTQGWEDYWDSQNGIPAIPENNFYMMGWYRASNADIAALKELEKEHGFYELSCDRASRTYGSY